MSLTDEEFELIDRIDYKMRRAEILKGKAWFDEHLGVGLYDAYRKLHDRLSVERPKHPTS